MLSSFNAEERIDAIVKWIREWFSENGPRASAVVGVSGGKDSSIVSALLLRALGRDRVVGVLMPDGEQADIADSELLVKSLGMRAYTVNVHAGVQGVLDSLERDTDLTVGKDTRNNTPPRIRMATLYAVAQSLPEGGRVANTCNRSEDYIGYSTKYGDAAGDFSPCASFTVSEMMKIGDALPELPRELVHKTPSDGLSGMSDEDKLGFTYEVLDRYILTGECPDAALKERIDRLHRLNLHKLRTIPTFSGPAGA